MAPTFRKFSMNLVEIYPGIHVVPSFIVGVRRFERSFRPSGYNEMGRVHSIEAHLLLSGTKTIIWEFIYAPKSNIVGEPDHINKEAIKKANKLEKGLLDKIKKIQT